MDQPGKVANPARVQLNMEKVFFLCSRSRLIIWFCETGSTAPSRASLLVFTPSLGLVLARGIPLVCRDGVHLCISPTNSRLCELRIDYLIEDG